MQYTWMEVKKFDDKNIICICIIIYNYISPRIAIDMHNNTSMQSKHTLTWADKNLRLWKKRWRCTACQYAKVAESLPFSWRTYHLSLRYGSCFLCLSVCLPQCLSLSPCLSLSVCLLYMYKPLCIYTCTYIFLSVCLLDLSAVCLSVCLSVPLFTSIPF